MKHLSNESLVELAHRVTLHADNVAELQNKLDAAQLRISALEAECNKYVLVLQKIEEYDPDWMEKIIGSDGRRPTTGDDGLDLLIELPGLVKHG